MTTKMEELIAKWKSQSNKQIKTSEFRNSIEAGIFIVTLGTNYISSCKIKGDRVIVTYYE